MNMIDQLIAGPDPLGEGATFESQSSEAEQMFQKVIALPRGRVAGVRRIRPRVLVASAAASIIGAASILIPLMGANAPSAAASELQRLSSIVAAAPDATLAPGQYEYTDSVGLGLVEAVERPSYNYNVKMHRQFWIGADGSGRIAMTYSDPTFPTPKDRAAWVSAGSPELSGSLPDMQSITNQSWGASSGSAPIDESQLPTDPSQLFAYVQAKANNPSAGQNFGELQEIASLFEERYTPPGLASALLTVASEIPGITLDNSATLPDAAAGMGFALTSNNMAGWTFKMELILNPTTGSVVGEKDWATSNSGSTDSLRWTHFVTQGVVNSISQTSATTKTNI